VVDWGISKEELLAFNDILQKLTHALAPFAEDLTIQQPLTDEWLWSGAHYAGTISLGTSPSEVVDPDLRMRCCENAFVCDGSVIQEHSAANTGLTIGQLALRAAHTVLDAS
jgi:choline dehydrogenase-like flavoprotein